MNAALDVPALDWRTANEAYLRAEVERVKALFVAAIRESSPMAVAEAEQAVRAARSELRGKSTIDVVSDEFGLTQFERSVLLLVAGVELDGDVAALCNAATGTTRSAATFDLAMSVLPDAHWSAISPSAPLRRWHLLDVTSEGRLAASPIRIEERVLHHLVGVDAVDPSLDPIVTVQPTGVLVSVGHSALASEIAEDWMPSVGGWPVLQLVGDDGEGQEDLAALVASRLGWSLAVAQSADLPSAASDRHAFAALWTRESLLASRALLIVVSGEAEDAVAPVADSLTTPTFVATRGAVSLRRPCRFYGVDRPRELQRRELWRTALGASGVEDARLEAIAGRLPFGARAIAESSLTVRAALQRGVDPVGALNTRLRHVRAGLEGLARRVEPAATWTELVLPDPTVGMLREIAAQVRNRPVVHDGWGFAARGARGLGITALFTGESGTGKTMAAEVLAGELGLDLYVIDLSAVVSKYIGETEKNLRRVFEAAEDGAILLFDEADALFGKRSDVRDSHDRYANIEVSYLLQRMDSYQGLAILTSNVRTAFDRAFQRRIRFVVSFPFPDVVQRERIWRGVFPRETPLGRLDWTRLAALDLSGGSIRNIAVNAAFLAADAGGPVRMRHLLAATDTELAKLERPTNGSERREW